MVYFASNVYVISVSKDRALTYLGVW